MCTLTIHQGKNNLTVTMNRDEKRERSGELPPYKWPDSDFWAPQDKKANGTWFGVNEKGRVACLLNGYAAGDTDNRELLIIHSVILVVCPEFVCVPCWISVFDFLMQ